MTSSRSCTASNPACASAIPVRSSAGAHARGAPRSRGHQRCSDRCMCPSRAPGRIRPRFQRCLPLGASRCTLPPLRPSPPNAKKKGRRSLSARHGGRKTDGRAATTGAALCCAKWEHKMGMDSALECMLHICRHRIRDHALQLPANR
jgi:hypothetical protein